MRHIGDRRGWGHVGRGVAVLAAAAGVVGALACASGELAPRAANDPANPAAPETPRVPPPMATASASTEVAPPQHHTHVAPQSAVGDAGVVYTCPMHPEISRPAPGRCPKCGMDLAPKPGG